MLPDLPKLTSTPLEVISKDALETLSTEPIAQEIRSPYNTDKVPLIDFARGGTDILDAHKGLDIKDWKCELKTDGIHITAKGSKETVIPNTFGDIEFLSFCFDQNMHYNFAYILKNKKAYLYWYDAVVEKYNTLELGKVNTPIVRMDDIRKELSPQSSIILSYIKDNNLYGRVQSDRFRVIYLLKEDVGIAIKKFGMNKGMRLQWVIKN